MFFSKKIVGVDIGDYAIKIVELSRSGKNFTLKNYAWAKTPEGAKNSPDTAAQALRQMMDEAGIKTKRVFFAIPDTSYFCTSFEIPPMTEKEVAGAVAYNASRYLTVPLSEVTLDWQIMPSRPGAAVKIFAAAVPNAVIDHYRSIAKKAGLHLIALEAEAFSTAAAFAPYAKIACIVDLGAKSSTISVVDGNVVKQSFTFNAQAKPLTESLAAEIKNVDEKFFAQEHKHIEEVYLIGGNATAPGLKDAIVKSLGKPIFIRNCFTAIAHPPALRTTLGDLSPLFAGAVGAAINGLQLKF